MDFGGHCFAVVVGHSNLVMAHPNLEHCRKFFT